MVVSGCSVEFDIEGVVQAMTALYIILTPLLLIIGIIFAGIAIAAITTAWSWLTGG